jgi:serine/threonine protein kinase
MLEGTYPFAEGQNDSLGMGHQLRIGQIQFNNAQNPHPQDIIRQLIQVRPDKRLSLDNCLKHPWVTAAPESLDPSLMTGQNDWHSAAWEECLRLPHEPLNPQQLRYDLSVFTKTRKFTATLRRGEAAPEVVVTWREACDKDKEAARDELMRLLGYHFPDGNFAKKPRARQAAHVLSTVTEERPPPRPQRRGHSG